MHEPIDWSWRDQILVNMWHHKDPSFLICRVVKIGGDSLRKRCRHLGLKPRYIMRNPPKNRLRVWSNKELRTLERMWIDNQPLAAIQDNLNNRSTNAIWTMRRKMGLQTRRPSRDRQIGFSVSHELFDRIGKEAAKKRMIRSQYLERLVREAIDREEAERTASKLPLRFRRKVTENIRLLAAE